MSARRRKPRPAETPGRSSSPRAGGVQVRRVVGEDAWELVEPRAALDRQDDLNEVVEMIAAGESEVAIDELRWLLEDCHELLAAHRLLGELHLADNDLELARAHFGYAYQIGLAAVTAAARPDRPRLSAAEQGETISLPGPLPYARSANQAFFEAAKGLAYCLAELKLLAPAAEVCRQMTALDPQDPLGFAALGQQLNGPV